jgi:hypothetical protein
LSYYTLNISPVSTVANTALVESALRDVGFPGRGYFFNDRLQYRGGIFDGVRMPTDATPRGRLCTCNTTSSSPEKEYAYAGTALGKRKILVIDVGGDKQGTYRSETANAAIDKPVNGGDEIGFNFNVMHFDGRTFFRFPTRPITWWKPLTISTNQGAAVCQVRNAGFFTGVNGIKDINRYGTGLNYYIHGQNLKWTFQYCGPCRRTARPSGRATSSPCSCRCSTTRDTMTAPCTVAAR